MTQKNQNDTLKSMRERLDALLPLHRQLRKELAETFKRAAEREPMHEKAFKEGGPFPDDKEEVAHQFDVMRRLSALGKEIISLMNQLPEYDDDSDEEP